MRPQPAAAWLLLVGAAVLFLALVLFGGLAVLRAFKSGDPFYGTFTNQQMSPQKWVTFPGAESFPHCTW